MIYLKVLNYGKQLVTEKLFGTQSECDTWLDKFKKSGLWSSDYVSISDGEPTSPEVAAEIEAKIIARKAAGDAIKSLDFSKLAAPLEIRDALLKIVVAIGLKD